MPVNVLADGLGLAPVGWAIGDNRQCWLTAMGFINTLGSIFGNKGRR